MLGAMGSIIKAASEGSPTARERVKGVFTEEFHTISGWKDMLDTFPGWSVTTLLGRRGAWWDRRCFQALYVACWIFHPLEKGTYMLMLESAEHEGNVTDAFDRLKASGELQSRISSHLSEHGASAHKGWHFLKGYHELLLQVEGQPGQRYLLLKCEGHPLEGGMSQVKHLASWAVKIFTGAGQQASAELNNLAKDSQNVELRAAENFSKAYEKLLVQLKLSGRIFSNKLVTVEEMADRLHKKAGFPNGLPDALKKNTHLLGEAMLGPQGYIAVWKLKKDDLKKKGIKFNDAVETELVNVAKRMKETASTHPQQHYNEIRVTARELDSALRVFRNYLNAPSPFA
jgi:hypothetical protein